jgi:putative transposase
MTLLSNAPAGLSKQRICAALGERRHRCYVDTRSRTRPKPARPQPRQLTSEQRQDALDALHAPEFCDASPRQVHAQLLSAGQVLASVSTFYRLLRAQGEAMPRRLQRPTQTHVRPQLVASAPNQVWTWDITKLPTVARGVYLNLYLILDLYSRFVVGWMISRKENAGLARHLFKRVLSAHAVAKDTLIVHQDRGSPMTAHTFAELLCSLGVERSHSRPRTSNDNPFSESQFKTLKYAPDYPGRFEDDDHARTWTRRFVDNYNHHRPHEGIALFTPANLFLGQVDDILSVRQQALDVHYTEHPERYVHGRPKAARPPTEVWINPDLALPADQLLATTGALKAQETQIEADLPEVVS